ncbi:MAG: GNAT family N-acetyltransferase, partial [Candidatus Nealsonbacteria bacterium]
MINTIAEALDKQGKAVAVKSYRRGVRNLRRKVMGLFREGYPDSFDEYDLEFIEEFLADYDEEEGQYCFLAFAGIELVGASMIEKVAGPQDQWETSYIFAKESFQGRGIGRILVGVQEECLKDKARVSFAINPGILPEDVISYPFWRTVGYELWGILPGYFRDDLSGIFLVKRNPYYAIGKNIPKNSGWEPSMADSITKERISEKEYGEILHDLKQAPKEKWGLDLIG